MVPGIDQLRDIRGLDSIPWWPPAPGWWLTGAVIVVLTLALLWWRDQRQRYPLGTWQKDAQRRLGELRRGLEQREPKQAAGELSELLRRIAMARFGREACAGLTGDEWLNWLKDKDASGFEWDTEGRILLQLPYAPAGSETDTHTLERLIYATVRWVFAKSETKSV